MTPRAEHVSVKDVQVWGDQLAPGLLIGWDQRDGEWWGYVIAAQAGIDARGAGPYVKQVWVKAEFIVPVDVEPGSSR